MRGQDSNLRPSAYETDEITTSPPRNLALGVGLEPTVSYDVRLTAGCITILRILELGAGCGIRTHLTPIGIGVMPIPAYTTLCVRMESNHRCFWLRVTAGCDIPTVSH